MSLIRENVLCRLKHLFFLLGLFEEYELKEEGSEPRVSVYRGELGGKPKHTLSTSCVQCCAG